MRKFSNLSSPSSMMKWKVEGNLTEIWNLGIMATLKMNYMNSYKGCLTKQKKNGKVYLHHKNKYYLRLRICQSA